MDIPAERIRNFSIIAHIDHGKSTLADRILEMTDTVHSKDMKAQLLDSMDLERERGITIKSQAVRVLYEADDGLVYQLHLIDTPGHVDFTYEVSRSLAACEGALLVVDAAQGVEAQTLANTYLAVDGGLELIPAMNKIDLPGAEPERVAGEIEELLGEPAEGVLKMSAKTGEGVHEMLEALVTKVPPPVADRDAPPRALIFDSEFDQYRGVIAYVRVVDGVFTKGDSIKTFQTPTKANIEDIGFFGPKMTPVKDLKAGEVGYIITGIKDVAKLRVGDTITTEGNHATEPLPGYREVQPMVFCGLFPVSTDDFEDLRDALEKLKLNDAALIYEPETSKALGFGFRVGFLGLLHMDIVRERLEREYDLDLLATPPNVRYEVTLTNGDEVKVNSPAEMPERVVIEETREPFIRATILTPREFVGTVMELCQERRGNHVDMQYISEMRMQITLRPAACRDRPRLLRPTQIAQPWLRLVRLRHQWHAGVRPRATRHSAWRRHCRRALDGRAQGQGVRRRPRDHRALEGAHPAPAVRRADSGRDRRQHRRPRNRQGRPQGRHGRLLRRRHLA